MASRKIKTGKGKVITRQAKKAAPVVETKALAEVPATELVAQEVVSKPEGEKLPIAKSKGKAKLVKSSGPTKSPRVKRAEIRHDVQSLYTGPSGGFNRSTSKTPVKINLFNSNPNLSFTRRTELVARTLKDKYGTETFVRGNADAWVLSRLVEKGHVQPVEGGETDLSARFQFTESGMSASYGS